MPLIRGTIILRPAMIAGTRTTMQLCTQVTLSVAPVAKSPAVPAAVPVAGCASAAKMQEASRNVAANAKAVITFFICRLVQGLKAHGHITGDLLEGEHGRIPGADPLANAPGASLHRPAQRGLFRGQRRRRFDEEPRGGGAG